jgi:hypothetical protein
MLLMVVVISVGLLAGRGNLKAQLAPRQQTLKRHDLVVVHLVKGEPIHANQRHPILIGILWPASL